MSQDVPSNPTPETLDEVMLAMDVVDTLRHREQLVGAELDSESRKADLINRLREIYSAQGIEVPDHILEDGVRALEERRFLYEPPEGGFRLRLARLYVSRERWWRQATGAVLALFAGLGFYQFGVAGPKRAEAARVEQALNVTLPIELVSLRDKVQRLAVSERVDGLAESYYQDGVSAIESRRAADAEASLALLSTLYDDLSSSYDVRIRYRGGADSGFTRVPDNAPSTRNYYLIVEAVAPSGDVLSVPIESEEVDTRARVKRWAQRVDQATFNRVIADKRDDQIIQNDTIGSKPRGVLAPEFSVPTPGGAILKW